MPDLSMPIFLQTLPILTLRETIREKYDPHGVSLESVAIQDTFCLSPDRHTLCGTLSGAIEPFPISFRGVNHVKECTIIEANIPCTGVEVTMTCSSPPVWLAVANFTGQDISYSICLVPTDTRPIMSFDEIYQEYYDCRRNLRSFQQTDFLAHLLENRFHVLMLDFSREYLPGIKTHKSSCAFWDAHEDEDAPLLGQILNAA